MRRAFLWWIAVGFLGGLLGWAALHGFLGRPPVGAPYSPEHRELLDSVRSARPVAGYLSGGLLYSPHPSRLVSPSPPPTSSGTVPPEISVAVRRAVGPERSPGSLATLAVLDLLAGAPEHAVTLLKEARHKKPSDPRILSDLAVASLTVYEKTGDPWAALEAVDSAAQSDHLKPSAPARFNMALALERLKVRGRSAVAWKRYLELDSRSPWAEEARQHLDQVTSEIARDQARPQLGAVTTAGLSDFPDNPWARRQLGERVFLTQWAERTLAHQPAQAEAALAQAEEAAASVTPDAGRLLAESIEVIREAEREGDRERLSQLALGHQAFGKAFLMWRTEHVREAEKLVEASVSLLSGAATPFALRARILQAWTRTDWQELGLVGKAADAAGFTSILAEMRRIAAYRMSLEGRTESALRAYGESKNRYREEGEREGYGVVSGMRAELLADIKGRSEIAVELAEALDAGPWVADPWNRYSIYFVVANSISRNLELAAAELLLEAADACPSLEERPLCGVDTRLWTALMAPDSTEARDAISQSERLLHDIPPSDGKVRTEIDVMIARARLLGSRGHKEQDRAEALALFDQAATQYDLRLLSTSAAEARVDRAALLQQMGLRREAVEDYLAALKIFRLWDRGNQISQNRSGYFPPATLRRAFEGVIGSELALAHGKASVAAFLLSDEMRERVIPWKDDSHASLQDHALHLAAAVPPGVAIIEYMLLGNRAVAWTFSEGRLDQVELSIRPRLSNVVSALGRERSLEEWKRISGSLFEELLAPVIARLPANVDRLFLVPDVGLYGLPFRALWNAKAERYLDEDYSIIIIPGVLQFLFGEGSREPAEMPRAVTLGIRRFSPDLSLTDLPLAEMEAREVERVYDSSPGACSAGDWKGFLRCAFEADVIHLATHAAAASPGGYGWIAFRGEVISLEKIWTELPSFDRSPVVVLSSCQSIAGPSEGEGLGGIARPFLAKGASVVIGTLWKLNDADGFAYFKGFHRRYRSSHDAVASLRSARASLREWSQRPWVWGGVELLSVSKMLMSKPA